MNALSIFTFQAEQSVRVETIKGEPWFCLKDVADILEIENGKASRFNLKEAGVHKMYLRSGGQNRELTFINEPNLYRVIFRSNKPEAVKFQDWIFEEVIPAIRKTGRYLHLDRWLTEWERAQIRAAVKERCERTGESSQTVYAKLHRFMGIPSYEQISAARFQTAMQFLDSIQDAPELFRQPEQPEAAMIDDDTLISIARLLLHAQRMRLFINRYLPAFENLGLNNKGALWSHVHDTEPTFENVRNFYYSQLGRLAQGEHKAANAWLHQRIAQTV